VKLFTVTFEGEVLIAAETQEEALKAFDKEERYIVGDIEFDVFAYEVRDVSKLHDSILDGWAYGDNQDMTIREQFGLTPEQIEAREAEEKARAEFEAHPKLFDLAMA